jgi:hypothetical protein
LKFYLFINATKPKIKIQMRQRNFNLYNFPPKYGKEISSYFIFPQNLASFSEKNGKYEEKNSPFSFCIWAKFCTQNTSTNNHDWKFFLGTSFFQVCSVVVRNPGPYSCKAHGLGLYPSLPLPLSPK